MGLFQFSFVCSFIVLFYMLHVSEIIQSVFLCLIYFISIIPSRSTYVTSGRISFFLLVKYYSVCIYTVRLKEVPSCEYAQHRVYSCIIIYSHCIIFHTNNCKTTFVPPCTYHIVFIHPPVDGHLGCIHVLAIVDNAARDTGCFILSK